MRAVIQRCARCEVQSEGEPCGRIGQGLVVLLGVQQGDTEKDADYMVDKNSSSPYFRRLEAES